MPTYSNLPAEEALVAALLLHDSFDALTHFTDDDIYFAHLAPVLATVRRLHGAGKPSCAVFVLHALEPQLDNLEWKGLRGEVMLLDLLGRHQFDPACFYGPALADLVRMAADERRRRERAQSAATQAYVTSPVSPVSGWSFVGE